MKQIVCVLLSCLLMGTQASLPASCQPFEVRLQSASVGSELVLGFDTLQQVLRLFSSGPTEDDFEDLGAQFLSEFDVDAIFTVLIPGFTSELDDAALLLNFRGLPILLTLPNIADDTLIFSIPDAGISETFTGVDRDASFAAFLSYLDANEKMLLNKILKASVKKSPVDPVAGNPSSLMSRMVGDNHRLMQRGLMYTQPCDDDCVYGWDRHYLQFNAFYHNYQLDGCYLYQVGGELTYAYLIGGRRNLQLMLDIPAALGRVGRAEVYQGSAALALKWSPTCRWTLTPIARVGGAFSGHLGGGALLASGAIGSDFVLKEEGTQIHLRNSIGWYQDVAVQLGDITLHPNIGVLGMKNGLGFLGGFCGLGSEWQSEVWVDCTNYLMEKVYAHYQVEVGTSLNLAPAWDRRFMEHFKLSMLALYAEHDLWGASARVSVEF